MRKVIENLEKFGYESRITLMCDCGHASHTLIVTKDNDDKDLEFYIDMYDWEYTLNLLDRIKWAIRYIFKGPSFGSIIVKAPQLKDFANSILEVTKEYEEKIKNA